MKLRALKKALNTDYIIHRIGSNIYVSTDVYPQIIKIETKPLKVLQDTKAPILHFDGLLDVYKKLLNMVETNEIEEYLNGDDVLEKELPVFYFNDGQIKETVTDGYGYPNLTVDGFLINETFYSSRQECLEQTIAKILNNIETLNKQIESHSLIINEMTITLNEYIDVLNNLMKELTNE